MYTGLYTAVAGSITQEKRLDVLTNNLANATTIGFKAEKSHFHGTFVQTVVGKVQVSERTPPVMTAIDPLKNRHIPYHPQITTYTDFSQGDIRETGNPLDIALEGSGFFVVEGANEETFYTRQGTFAINSEGLLVTQNGLLVQGESGPIKVQGSQVRIDKTGGVSIEGTVVDRLKLVDFSQPYPLAKMGDALFHTVGPDPQTEEPSNLAVHQGAVELSNSSLIQLLGKVIQTSRAYEAYQRMIRTFDDTAERAVNDIART